MEVSNQVNSVLEQYSRKEEVTEKSREKSRELGKDEFLKLLVTQMNNQNPLEPQDNGEFIAQLAQFSSLEGIDNLNETMGGFVSSYQSNLALEATALVGRQVQVQTDTAWLSEGEPFTGEVQLPVSSSAVTVGIYDQNGQLVRRFDLGSRSAGDLRGAAMSSGMYTVKAEAKIDGETQQLPTLLGANVNSVTLGTNGSSTTLNLAGIGKVDLKDVRTIQ